MTRGANHARGLLPRLLPDDRTFEVHAFQGKADLLGKPGARLPGYAQWLPADWRLFVIVDRDDEDCRALKQRLEALATRAGLVTRAARPAPCPGNWSTALPSRNWSPGTSATGMR